jgi:hypothetical protein
MKREGTILRILCSFTFSYSLDPKQTLGNRWLLRPALAEGLPKEVKRSLTNISEPKEVGVGPATQLADRFQTSDGQCIF